MILSSTLSPNQYLSHLKEQMGGHFSFGMERFTGFFSGSYFCITHHAGYEWNRKYTNQKNCALGFIRKTETGCEVRFIRFKGALCPPQFIGLTLMMFILMLLMFLLEYQDFHVLVLAVCAGLSLIITSMAALIATFFECLTPESEEGRKILIALLMDPADPFSYLHNKDKIR